MQQLGIFWLGGGIALATGFKQGDWVWLVIVGITAIIIDIIILLSERGK